MATRALAAGTAAMGQWFPEPTWTQRIDHPDAKHNPEVALAVSKANREIMVAWMHASHATNFDPKVFYNVSVDGNSFLPRNLSTAVPLPMDIPGTDRGFPRMRGLFRVRQPP
jgi:hypothetical protein